MIKKSIFIILSLLTVLSAYSATSLKIISDAFDGKVEVDQTFHITIEATDCPGNINVAKMPAGVKVVYQTTRQATKVASINGKTEQETTTSLILTCKGETPGKYTFGPVTIAGKKSNTIAYQVVTSSGGGNNSGNNGSSLQSSSNVDPNAGPLFVGKGNEEMYLRASVNKTTAYEKEAIEYSVKLYTTYGDIKFLGAAAAPKFEGFVVEESPDISTSFKFEDIGGKTFKTAVIAKYIIFPQKAGKLKIQGNTYTVSTDARQYYHDPYFQTITVKQPIQLNVTPNEVELNIKGLPQPIPSDFFGGVGNFSVTSSLPESSISSGTAATLIFTIHGSGNIKYLKFPDLNSYFPKSFEIYSPEVSSEVNVVNSTVSGTSKFEYSFIPREPGTFDIPSVSLSYFDPNEGQYKTLHTERFHVTVTKGNSSALSQKTMTFNSELLDNGKLLNSEPKPFVYSFYYWLWYLVPVVCFSFSLIIYRRYRNQRDDMVMYKSKVANKMALRRLAKAQLCIKNKDEEQFYNEMLAALWGYLADKLKIHTSELNRSNVEEEFRKHGVKESTFQPIISLIDECEYAKYTPVAREANMRQLYADAVESISRVEKEYEEETRKNDNSDSDVWDETQDKYINTTNPINDNGESEKTKEKNENAD